MIFQQLGREDPLRMFIAVLNNEGAVLPANTAVQWQTGAQANGNRVRQPDTNELAAKAGIVDADIQIGDFGLLQLAGYRSAISVLLTGTPAVAGSVLVAVAGAGTLSPATPSATNWPTALAVVLEDIPTGAAPANLKGVVHAL